MRTAAASTKPPADRRPAVVGHRGASADCPENTLAAFDEALRQGADGFELDVQMSRDEVPVVYHDRTLAKAGLRNRRVGELTLAELGRLDAGGWFDGTFRGERLPTLEQVLDRYGERPRLLIEIKARDADAWPAARVRNVAALIGGRARARTTILCFDADVLARFAVEAPHLPRALNLAPPRRMTRALNARLGSFDALSVDVRTLTPAFAAAVRDAGLPLYTYTCNTPRRVERAVRAGVDAIMSDRPGWLATYLTRREGAGAT